MTNQMTAKKEIQFLHGLQDDIKNLPVTFEGALLAHSMYEDIQEHILELKNQK